MYLKFKLDFRDAAFVQVQKSKDDGESIDIYYEFFSERLEIPLADLKEIDAIASSENQAEYKKHFWLSVDGDRNVYLSLDKPIRNGWSFVYNQATSARMPEDFVRYATKIDLEPMERPVLFTYTTK